MKKISLVLLSLFALIVLTSFASAFWPLPGSSFTSSDPVNNPLAVYNGSASLVSQQTIDKTNYGNESINGWFGVNLANVQLLQNTYTCDGIDCKAYINLKLNGDTTNPFSGLTLTNMKTGQPADINVSIQIFNGYYNQDFPVYSTQCIDNQPLDFGSQSNWTTGQICSQVQTSTQTIQVENWTDYDSTATYPAGSYIIKLEGINTNEENIEWIPTFLGNKITQWANWYASTNLTYDLQDYFTLNGTLANSVPGGVTLVNNSCAYNANGKIGQANYCGNNNNNKLNISYAQIANQSFSFNMWINVSGGNTLNNYIIAQQSGAQTPFLAFSSTGGYIVCNNGNSPNYDTNYTISSNYNQSVMFTFVSHDGCYINGVRVTKDAGEINFTTTGTFGSSIAGPWDGISTRSLNGQVDEIGIWNTTLTQSQITLLYNSGQGVTYSNLTSLGILISNMTLISPTNNTVETSMPVLFNASITGLNVSLSNVSLWYGSSPATFSQQNYTTVTGLSNTTIFNQVNITNGNYNWTYQWCAADGTCTFTPVNYSLNISVNPNIPPTINLSNPIGEYVFIANKNLTVNWNITDTSTSISACWYNYNNINVSVVCSTNISQINITSLSLPTNLTLYSNDSFNNIGSVTTYWSWIPNMSVNLVYPTNNSNFSVNNITLYSNDTYFGYLSLSNTTFYIWNTTGLYNTQTFSTIYSNAFYCALNSTVCNNAFDSDINTYTTDNSGTNYLTNFTITPNTPIQYNSKITGGIACNGVCAPVQTNLFIFSCLNNNGNWEIFNTITESEPGYIYNQIMNFQFNSTSYPECINSNTLSTNLTLAYNNENVYENYLTTPNISSSINCYQAIANTSNYADTQYCSLNYSGKIGFSGSWTNPKNTYDGNWNTYGYSSSGSSYMYINYSIPPNAGSALIEYNAFPIAPNYGWTNYSLPSNCFNNPIQLVINSTAGTGGNNVSCKTNTGSLQQIVAFTGGSGVYEVPIIWNLPSDTSYNLYNIPDGNYTWNVNYTGYNTSTIISAQYPINYSFLIDTTPPIINLSQPSGYYAYSLTGNNNLSVNWTTYDTGIGLGTCWYSYAGINTTVTCSANSTYINVTNTANNNLTFYANDTAGNTASQNTSWNYYETINSQSYLPISTSFASDNFGINITFPGSIISRTVQLVYNGTIYNANYNFDGTNYIYYANITTLLVSSQTSLPFYWVINVIDNSNNYFYTNTTTLTQTVNPLAFNTGCGTNNDTVLNYSLVDEDTLQKYAGNTTIQVQINISAPNLYGSSAVYGFNFVNSSSPAICVNKGLLNVSSLSLSATARYWADNRVIAYNNIQNYILNNNTLIPQINLADLLITEAQQFQITFNDASFIPQPGVLITIERQYLPNVTYYTTESPVTDSHGNALGYFIINNVTYYTIVASKNGATLGTFNTILPICQDVALGQCTIILDTFSSQNNVYSYSNQYNVNYAMSWNATYNSTTGLAIASFYSTDGAVRSYQFNVTKLDNYQNNTICSTKVNTSSGAISCFIPSGSYIGQLYVNGQYLGQEIFSISPNPAAIWGGARITLIIILLVTLPLMALTSAYAALLLGLLALVIAAFLDLYQSGGLTGIGFTLGWLILAVGLIMWKMNDRGST